MRGIQCAMAPCALVVVVMEMVMMMRRMRHVTVTGGGVVSRGICIGGDVSIARGAKGMRGAAAAAAWAPSVGGVGVVGADEAMGSVLHSTVTVPYAPWTHLPEAPVAVAIDAMGWEAGAQAIRWHVRAESMLPPVVTRRQGGHGPSSLAPCPRLIRTSSMSIIRWG